MEVLVDPDTNEASFISTKLVAQLLSAIDSAELGRIPQTDQSGDDTDSCPTSANSSKLRNTASTSTGRPAAVVQSIKAGEEDVLRQIRNLHLELINGVGRIHGEQGGTRQHRGGEQERSGVRPEGDAGHQSSRGDRPDLPRSDDNHHPSHPGPLQVDGTQGMLAKEANRDAALPGMPNGGPGYGHDGPEDDGSLSDISEDGTDDNTERMVEFVVETAVHTNPTTQVLKGVPKEPRGGPSTKRGTCTGEGGGERGREEDRTKLGRFIRAQNWF